MARGTGLRVLCLLGLLGACWSGPRYDEGDLRPEAELVFPGAVETRRVFYPDESGRSVDGFDMSYPAYLERKFDLEGPTPSREIYEWYQRELAELGWVARSAELAVSGDSAQFIRTDGDRDDLFNVNAGFFDDTVTSYDIHYSIDVDLSR